MPAIEQSISESSSKMSWASFHCVLFILYLIRFLKIFLAKEQSVAKDSRCRFLSCGGGSFL